MTCETYIYIQLSLNVRLFGVFIDQFVLKQDKKLLDLCMVISQDVWYNGDKVKKVECLDNVYKYQYIHYYQQNYTLRRNNLCGEKQKCMAVAFEYDIDLIHCSCIGFNICCIDFKAYAFVSVNVMISYISMFRPLQQQITDKLTNNQKFI